MSALLLRRHHHLSPCRHLSRWKAREQKENSRLRTHLMNGANSWTSSGQVKDKGSHPYFSQQHFYTLDQDLLLITVLIAAQASIEHGYINIWASPVAQW